MNKAIIIGASSGIGREIATTLACNGYVVGLAARRSELLHELKNEIPTKTYVKRIDVIQTNEAMTFLNELIAEMGGGA